MEQAKVERTPAFLPLEAYTMRLRALFEGRGYRRVRPPRFEDYALLLDNKNFLGTDRILTFMDPGGRMLSLKPDTTLSLASEVSDDILPCAEKLYYTDEVARYDPENLSYRITEQVGVELIGREDAFSAVEAADLALRSLCATGEESVLDISHLGFVKGLLAGADLGAPVEREVLGAIHSRSAHNLCGILDSAGVENGHRASILELAAIHGPFNEQLARAGALVRGPYMEEAFSELEALGASLSPGPGQRLNLDFSVVGDLDYYNGLVLRGYIKGIPGMVLGGGRYDNLMAKLGKKSTAIGFAVYLHRLENSLAGAPPATDILLLYPKDCDPAALLREAERLGQKGLTVRCEREDGDFSGLRFNETVYFKGVKPDA
ncbi:MAG: ATP phosphoribosyltransferase regulatory subunit [Oscillospiraceae bacterium]|jgi:ATP phosphoribosyltransferase regulatory subunit|nr:ATP phosphoribosyltransferase regulatory subunit [Oscillospiraceae bacterium]